MFGFPGRLNPSASDIALVAVVDNTISPGAAASGKPPLAKCAA
jgi:hypothetical protein